MPRYVAFLRGVSPMNAKMPELIACFEAAGFTNVTTALSSGNVIFDARTASTESLEKKIEKALEKELGRTFPTIVRSQADLDELLEQNPFKNLKLSPKTKRVVSFLKKAPEKKIGLPLRKDGVHIFHAKNRTVFSTYEPHPKGPVFMILLEKTFGKSITTRTWETVGKVVRK